MKMNFVKTGINGEGISYDHRRPVFCPGVLATETAEIRITESNLTYARAECVRILEPSVHRIPSACPHSTECGGCPFLCADHDFMIEQKLSLLKEALYKYGNVKESFIRGMHEAPLDTRYRSACKLPVRMVDGKLVTGMYAAGTNRFIPVEDCLVHTEEIETLRRSILAVLNKYSIPAFDAKKDSGLRYLVLRSIQSHAQCAFITGKHTSFPKECLEELMNIPAMESIVQSLNSDRRSRSIFGSACRTLAGTDHILIEIEGIWLRLNAESFFQLNTAQAAALYRTAVAKVQNCEALTELYCGVGAMSLMAKDRAAYICGIENVPAAIRNARYNAEINGVTNAEFLCADAAEGYRKMSAVHRFDTVLADPPRSGMDEAMLEALEEYPADRLIYISCNPVTLAKNIRTLKKTYELRTVIPFDLFPQTPHVESITVMTRRGVKGL